MFTKNWYALLSNAMTGIATKCRGTNGSLADNSQAHSIKAIYLGAPAQSGYSPYPSLYTLKTGYAGGGVVLGNGTAEPSVDDYKMSGSLITTFTSTVSVTQTSDGDGSGLTALYTITNTASTDITISEIGLIACGNGNYHANDYMALIERTLLETPVTIPPGGVGQITYTIEVKNPVPFPAA